VLVRRRCTQEAQAVKHSPQDHHISLPASVARQSDKVLNMLMTTRQ
jgi:hypothetical protein